MTSPTFLRVPKHSVDQAGARSGPSARPALISEMSSVWLARNPSFAPELFAVGREGGREHVAQVGTAGEFGARVVEVLGMLDRGDLSLDFVQE